MWTRGIPRRVLGAGGLLAAVVFSALATVHYAPTAAEVPLWWPTAGLATALLVISARPLWWPLVPAVAVAGALAQHTAGAAPAVSGTLGASYALGALVGGWWLTRGGVPSLRRQDGVGRLLAGAVAGAAVTAAGVAATSVLLRDGPLLVPLVTALGANAAAVLVVTSITLAHQGDNEESVRGDRRWTEQIFQWLVLVGTVAVLFGADPRVGLGFLVVPPLAWAALRLGTRTVAWQLLLVAVAASVSTQRGGGPFALTTSARVDDAVLSGWLVQGFVVACVLVTLPLAAAVEQRRSAVTGLGASEQRFRTTFEQSPVGMLLLARRQAGRLEITETNAVAADILGLSPDELEGEDLGSMLSMSTSLTEVTADLCTGRTSAWREEVVLAAKPWCRLCLSVAPLAGAGAERMFIAQLVDVTAAHEATARLRTEKDLSAAILDTTGCLIVLVALDGTVVGINRAAQAVSGFGDEDVRDRPLWETLVAKDHRTTVELMFGDPTGAAVPTSQESDLRTKNGGRRRVVWSNAFLTDERGRRTHVVMTGIDVTSQRETTGLLTHLLGAATKTAFVATDLNGRITVFNAGAERMFGYPARDVVGRQTPDRLLDPGELARRAAELGMQPGFPVLVADVGQAAEPHTRDWTGVRKDGSRLTVALTLSTVRDAVGRHIGYLAVGEDVTAQRRDHTELLAALEKQREQVGRLALSALGAGDRHAHGELDLREVVARCYHQLPAGAGSALELPEGPVTVCGNPEQLERMAGELLHGAVSGETAGPVTCRLAVAGADAVLEVNATGSEQDIAAMAAVESVVRDHDGDLTVRPAAEGGRTVTLRIPLAQAGRYVGSHAAR